MNSLKVVLSAFFGVKKKNAEKDLGSIKPLHLVFSAISLALLFVSTIVIIVKVIFKVYWS